MQKADVGQSKLNHDPCLELILCKRRDCDKWESSAVRKGEGGMGETLGLVAGRAGF